MKILNATQHKQNSQEFAKIGIEIVDPGFVAYENFNPRRDVREQCVQAWRTVLEKTDEVLEDGGQIDGYLLGGYAPAVLALYQYLSQFRKTSYVAIMGQALIVEGQRRQFVLAGVRRVPTPYTLKKKGNEEGQPFAVDHDFVVPNSLPRVNHDRLIHLSARPLTEERAKDVSFVAPQKLIGVAPVLPPPVDHDLGAFEREILDVADLAVSERCGILIDGAPAESFLRVFGVLGSLVPFYFLKTEVKPDQKLPSIVALEKIPRF